MKCEADLEVAVRNWCKKNGWKRKKMSSPGTRGTLDDYFIKDGRHVWIEMKWGNNTPTKIQWKEINDIREHGGESYWCNQLDQVVAILEANGAFTGLPPQHEYLM